jgi:cytochrome oxidase Cu insertion factor (SCO1/SenC/PrrC family)
MKIPRFFCLLAAAALLASPLLARGAPTTGPSESGDKPAVGMKVGQTAPEIKGTDVHGKAIKLSDFKGKIVVLDFFGDW